MVSIALGQLRDPMNLMLVAVATVSVIIGEVSTALVVALLVALNLTLVGCIRIPAPSAPENARSERNFARRLRGRLRAGRHGSTPSPVGTRKHRKRR